MNTLFDKAAILEMFGQSVGPLNKWTFVRESTIALMIKEGLKPDSMVVDLGAGHMRLGSFLVPNLDAGKYHAIEPRKEVVIDGVLSLVGIKTWEDKKATVTHNTDFDLNCGRPIDMVVARSIWSHATLFQIDQCLESFVKNAKKGAKLLASYYPARPHKRNLWPYYGDQWCYPGGPNGRPMSAFGKWQLEPMFKTYGLKWKYHQIKGDHQRWIILETRS